MALFRTNLVEYFSLVLNAVEDDCQDDSVYMYFSFKTKCRQTLSLLLVYG
jgi:hypothetical protein